MLYIFRMRILVVRFSALGDVVLVTPLFQKIKARYPKCHLDFLTDMKFQSLFSNDPHIDSIIPYNIAEETPANLLRLIGKIRGRNYDYIIDVHLIPRSLLILFLGKAIVRRRINKYTRQRRRMVASCKQEKIPHVVDRYLETINGKNSNRYRPKIYFEEWEIEEIRKGMNGIKDSRKIVGFSPGASKKTKIWEIDKLRKLAQSLIFDHELFIIFLGNKNEIPLIAEISKALDSRFLNLAGKTDPRQLALYLHACDVLFTTDSGPMHIAVAAGTPVVAVFGPTVEAFGFSPYDERSVVISKQLPCRPCSLHGRDSCPLGHHNCLKLIDVNEVKDMILGCLKVV
ncbi:MAG: lipopolysaccharide heptosyltransferase II [Candidatus Cloacimonadota bacterium]|nr:MAG: lipopolysaccharide heptosyltransferase II [Candidatus Cloacimonadota bacterium]